MNNPIRVAAAICAVVLAAAAGLVIATHGRGFDRQTVQPPAAAVPPAAQTSYFNGQPLGTPPPNVHIDLRGALNAPDANAIMPCGDRYGTLYAVNGDVTYYCVRGHRFRRVQGAFVPAD